MACEICEHCQEPILDQYDSVMRAGWSYHSECHKCYVCSETNLRDAEIFKGVIFCSSCSKRIFQGCSSAKQHKDTVRRKPEPRSVTPKRRGRSKLHKQRKPEPEPEPQSENVDVIELARFTRPFNSDSDKNQPIEAPEKITLSSMLSVYFDNGEEEKKSMKRNSAEIGMMTEVTMEFLKEINCPVPENKTCEEELTCYGPQQEHQSQKHVADSVYNPLKYDFKMKFTPSYQWSKEQKDPEQIKPRRKPKYSDIRMVEMGASTEIANMTLRKPSELPLMMMKNERQHYGAISGPLKISSSTNYSSKSLDFESKETIGKLSTSVVESRLMFITFLRKLYTYFKRNILDRSSLISVLMTSVNDHESFFSKIKDFFIEDICPHHLNGISRLYSTKKQRKPSYKLGWPHGPVYGTKQKKPCKHYSKSDSYRCLRNYVMRRAGPTKSELDQIRGNIAKILTPRFIKNIFISKDTVSAACGDSEAASKCSPRIKAKFSQQSYVVEPWNLRKANFVQNYTCCY